jgi:hypothetical protein
MARRPLEIEWRIPWDAAWEHSKKVAAAERLVDYMRRGTFFDTTSRMKVASAEVRQINPSDDPYIVLTLE